MDHAALLQLLRAHAGQPLDPREAAATNDTIRFVESHPDCLLRSCVPGHMTGSAWIVNPARTGTLLMHHLKLDRWLQPGGHADGESDLLRVAWREAREECGLGSLRPLSASVFDLDVHVIPARQHEPSHRHYDLRFLFEADDQEPLRPSAESKELAWIDFTQVTRFNPEESIARMVRKTRHS